MARPTFLLFQLKRTLTHRFYHVNSTHFLSAQKPLSRINLPTTASIETVYQTIPLDSQKKEIRLLAVQPASSPTDELVCTLSRASLEDKVNIARYEALSYVWGAPLPSYDIIINETPFNIRENLYHALVSLRCKNKERLLWADAVCINQNDLAERCQQVQIMYMVFSKAERVIAWLGEKKAADNDAQSAFENLSRYMASWNGKYDSTAIMRQYYTLEGTSFPNSNSPDWVPIKSIMGKSWFSRVWIIQEFVMAARLSFRCGDVELDRSVIENTLEFLSLSKILAPAFHRAFFMIEGAKTARLSLARSEPSILMDVLLLTKIFDASIPRDRLFACLKFLNPEHESYMVPEYTMPDSELYTQWAAYSLSEKPPFRCLSLADPIRSSLAENLPTWAPDWENCCLYNLLAQIQTFQTLSHYPPRIQLPDCQKYLTLGGLRLGTIQAVGSKMVHKEEWMGRNKVEADDIEALWMTKAFVEEAEAIATKEFSPRQYPLEMFWRTLIADCAHNVDGQSPTHRAPARYAQSFEGLRKVLSYDYNGIDWSAPGNLEEFEKTSVESIEFNQTFAAYAPGRKFGVTHDLRMGMFPEFAQPGDLVFAPLGSNIPFVFREAKNGRYALVGECYVHGLMYGEATQEKGWEEKIEDITIC